MEDKDIGTMIFLIVLACWQIILSICVYKIAGVLDTYRANQQRCAVVGSVVPIPLITVQNAPPAATYQAP